MCGGDMPENRMGQLLLQFDSSGDLLDINCMLPLTSAKKIAGHLETTPQIVGKLMKINDDMIGRKTIRVDGKREVFFFSKNYQRM